MRWVAFMIDEPIDQLIRGPGICMRRPRNKTCMVPDLVQCCSKTSLKMIALVADDFKFPSEDEGPHFLHTKKPEMHWSSFNLFPIHMPNVYQVMVLLRTS